MPAEKLVNELSALTTENEMLHRKMDLLKENAALKQNAIISSFLSWMDRRDGKPREANDPYEKELESPRKQSSTTKSFDKNGSFDGVSIAAGNETKLAGSPDVTINKERRLPSSLREEESRPVTSTPLKADRYSSKSLEERRRVSNSDSKNISRNSSLTRTTDKNRSSDYHRTSFIDETRLAGSPDITKFTSGRKSSRPVTSTPFKSKNMNDRSASKRVVFEDEMADRKDSQASRHRTSFTSSSNRRNDQPRIKNQSDFASSRGSTCLSNTTVESLMLASEPGADASIPTVAPRNKDDKDDDADVSHLRMTGKNATAKVSDIGGNGPLTLLGSRDTSGNSRGGRTMSPSSGYFSREQSENGNPVRRNLQFDVSSGGSNRSPLDPNKFFNSRSPTRHPGLGPSTTTDAEHHGMELNHKTDTLSSPRRTDPPRNLGGVNVGSEEMTNSFTDLEVALQDIYRRNLEDELKITEIRRDALRRFAAWRDAVDREMAKLENKKRTDAICDEVGETRAELNMSADYDHTIKGFPINLAINNISEGRLSQLEETAAPTRSSLKLEDLENTKSRLFSASNISHANTEDDIIETNSPWKLSDKRRSGKSETMSSSCSFMSSPETVIIGEVAFQLERTILAMVFRGGSKQLTGYTLSNMEKMLHSHYDIGQRPALEMQLREVKGNLNICGWKPDYHPKLIADLIRTYGTFPSNAVTSKLVKKHGWTDPRTLKETILWGIPKERIHDMIIILDCLIYLSRKANIPLFTW